MNELAEMCANFQSLRLCLCPVLTNSWKIFGFSSEPAIGKFLFCVASTSACDDGLLVVKFNCDRRAVGLLRVLLSHRDKKMDTPWGEDGSARVRPQLVNRIRNKYDARTKCTSKWHTSTKLRITPSLNHVTRASTWLAPTSSHVDLYEHSASKHWLLSTLIARPD